MSNESTFAVFRLLFLQDNPDVLGKVAARKRSDEERLISMDEKDNIMITSITWTAP
jgi:hypothetical protein